MKALLSSADGSRIVAIIEVGEFAESCFHRYGEYEFDLREPPELTMYQSWMLPSNSCVERVRVLGTFNDHTDNPFLLTIRIQDEKNSAILEAYYEQFSHGIGLEPKETDRLVFAFLRALKS